MKLLLFVWALMLPIGFSTIPSSSAQAHEEMLRVTDRDDEDYHRSSLDDFDTGSNRPTLDFLVSNVFDDQHHTERESLRLKALAAPPAKVPASDLEQWWREAEPGSLRFDDIQQRIPTEELIDWLTRAYQDGIAPEQVQAALQATQWQTSSNDLQLVDIDDDGKNEWLVTIYFFNPESMPWGAPGDFWVVGNDGLEYRFFTPDRYFDDRYDIQPEFFLSAPTVIGTTDMTGDGVNDVVLDRSTCGAHTCTYFYSILSHHYGALGNVINLPEPSNGETIMMTYADVQPMTDATGDGLHDFLIHGGAVGSVGSGIQRTRTEVWAWNGEAIALADVRLDPTDFRYHLLWEANDEFDQGNLDRASVLYQQVIGDRSLRDEGSFNDDQVVYADSRQFAAFRLTLMALIEEEDVETSEWSQWLHTEYSTSHLTSAVDVLLDTAQSNSLEASCSAVTSYLEQFEVRDGDWVTESPTGALRDMGYANPSLTAKDVCPL